MRNFRIGNGYDVHALKTGLPLIIGGVKIDHHAGFIAHSDGDVLIHALCDALLGSLALGDIGLHFPDTDPAYRGIDSRQLLSKCISLIREQGWELANCDCTIIAQAPKLRPYIDLMRNALALALTLPIDRISIKATTTENLGFTGRQEGIAAQASVLIFEP